MFRVRQMCQLKRTTTTLKKWFAKATQQIVSCAEEPSKNRISSLTKTALACNDRAQHCM